MAYISIHALRVEGDLLRCWHIAGGLLFLSTPSGWRATYHASVAWGWDKFLSTPSGWRATIGYLEGYQEHKISIHALRVEGD